MGLIDVMSRHYLPKRVGMPVMHHVETAVHVHTDGRPLCMRMGQSYHHLCFYHHSHMASHSSVVETKRLLQNRIRHKPRAISARHISTESARRSQGDAGRPGRRRRRERELTSSPLCMTVQQRRDPPGDRARPVMILRAPVCASEVAPDSSRGSSSHNSGEPGTFSMMLQQP